MSEDELKAIEARATAATPGLWECFQATDHESGPWYFGPKRGEQWSEAKTNRADAQFIAHAREDIPALVAEVRTLRRLLSSVYETCLDNGAVLLETRQEIVRVLDRDPSELPTWAREDPDAALSAATAEYERKAEQRREDDAEAAWFAARLELDEEETRLWRKALEDAPEPTSALRRLLRRKR